MKIKDCIELQASLPEGQVAFVLMGSFYRGFDSGAYALAHLAGYKVMERKLKGHGTYLMAGFPLSQLNGIKAMASEAASSIVREDKEVIIFSGLDLSPVAPCEPHTRIAKAHNDSENDSKEMALRTRIAAFDTANSTPMQAFGFICELQKEIR